MSSIVFWSCYVAHTFTYLARKPLCRSFVNDGWSVFENQLIWIRFVQNGLRQWVEPNSDTRIQPPTSFNRTRRRSSVTVPATIQEEIQPVEEPFSPKVALGHIKSNSLKHCSDKYVCTFSLMSSFCSRLSGLFPIRDVTAPVGAVALSFRFVWHIIK